MNRKTSIGIIGCGNISSIYLQAPRLFDILRVVACADIDIERARSQAEKYGVPKACTVEELLSDPEVEIVVNLTIPKKLPFKQLQQENLSTAKSPWRLGVRMEKSF